MLSAWPSWLVVTDAYDPGWRALVDGKPQRVERLNFVQRGVRVPRGRSLVTLRYRPPWFIPGLCLSAAAWLWAGLLLFV